MNEDKNKKLIKRINQFRIIGLVEGISYLVLLGIAMPLKYFAGFPEAVKVVGLIHGVLFILYFISAFWANLLRKWSFLMLLWIFVASLIPFGTFILDKQLKDDLQ